MTPAPPSCRSPAVSTDTIFTLASAADGSVSMKPKSAASNVYSPSSSVSTVLSDAVGAALGLRLTETLSPTLADVHVKPGLAHR